jgi:hypothetical protein
VVNCWGRAQKKWPSVTAAGLDPNHDEPIKWIYEACFTRTPPVRLLKVSKVFLKN